MKWIIMASAAYLFGYTLIVATRFMLKWRAAQRAGLGGRMLPLHIWTVALSYDMFVLGAAVQAFVLIRWWHPWVFLPATAMGIYAMWVINKGQSRPVT